MKARLVRVADTVARLAVLAVSLASAVWGVMAYVPFTYVQVVQTRLFEPFSLFADWHVAFVWLATAAMVMLQRQGLVARRSASLALTVVMVLASLTLTVRPVWPHLGSGPLSLWAAVCALVPAAWLALLEGHESWPDVMWCAPNDDDADDVRVCGACAGAGVFAWVTYTGAAWLRGGDMRLEPLWSLPAHLVLFGGLFLATLAVRAVCAWSHAPAKAEWWLMSLVLTGVVAVVLVRLVFAAIAFSGPPAMAMATALGAVLVLVRGSAVLRGRGRRCASVSNGVLAWLSAAQDPKPLVASCGLVLLAAAAGGVAIDAAVVDWNFLVQKLSAVVVWGVALGLLLAVIRPRRRVEPAALVLAVCLAPVALAVVEVRADTADAERAAGFNGSFRLIRDLVMPQPASAQANALYAYLDAHTNIARDRTVAPVPIDFVAALRPSTAVKPHVFVIVVDSLRRDYLSPYNRAVTFTPAIDALAKDSTVFTRSFSRYGATGLSEPSIWAGAMLLHKQYVTPFAPMNGLEKLVTANGYRRMVSVDSILRTLLTPAGIEELDPGVQTKDLDLCRTLDEVGRRVTAPDRPDTPMFVYTQPQNVHVSTLAREGNSVPEGESYPGFHAPYASRVRRVDACVGTFVSTLKMAGLYDESVIVFTADHGDSLGEEGRFGHAYTIYPEIIRTPLLVHLPKSLTGKYHAAPDGLVFTTDITPTLYTLLGARPTLSGFPFGAPLFTAEGDAAPAPRTGSELVASSYGTVYGLVERGGRHLYIVDAVNFQEHAYDLEPELNGHRVTVTPAERSDAQRAIRQQVDTIARTYHFDAAR